VSVVIAGTLFVVISKLVFCLLHVINAVFLLVDLVLGRPFVSPMLSDCCPVCLSVTLVYCGQTVGWIKMKLGMQVGLRLATLC